MASEVSILQPSSSLLLSSSFISEVLQPFELSAMDDPYDPYIINNAYSSGLILVSQLGELELMETSNAHGSCWKKQTQIC